MTLRNILLSISLLTASVAHADDWMGTLPDATPVAAMTIPGTHDAATGDGFLPGDEALGRLIGRTQECTLSAQWAAGIRAFDLRPAVRTDEDGRASLHIYHGKFATRLSFDDALCLLEDSLAAHPTECAIIVMRHESSSSRREEHWAELMRDCLARHSGRLATLKPSLRLGDLRGRILILSRDRYAERPFGAYVGGWCHEAGLSAQQRASLSQGAVSVPLWVQDYYDTSGPGALRTKMKALQAMLRAATARTDDGQEMPWVITHTSGYALTVEGIAPEPVSLTRGYLANAARTNAYMIKLLGKRKNAGPAGIVMMDFGGADVSDGHTVYGLRLVRELIAHNTRR